MIATTSQRSYIIYHGDDLSRYWYYIIVSPSLSMDIVDIVLLKCLIFFKITDWLEAADVIIFLYLNF